MRISDWSSDVCSSDLIAARARGRFAPAVHFLVNRFDRGLVGGMTGEIVENLAAQAIAGADANRLEPVEHVELGQRDAGDARHGAALAHQHRVEPTAATLAPGHGAEFMPALAELLPGLVVEFGGRSEEHTSELQSLLRIS